MYPVGAELFTEDGRTDRTKLIVACRNYAKAPNDTGGEGLHIEGNGTGSKRTLMWKLNMFR
jgi:hypothetical protein